MSSSNKKIILVDFDDTVARENTTPGFFDFMRASNSMPDVNTDVNRIYESFRSANAAAAEEALADVTGDAVDRLRRFGARVRAIEIEAIGVAPHTGLAGALTRWGIGPHSFRPYSQQVTTHPGCISSLSAARSQGHDVGVVSMNFFGQLLQEVIYAETALHGIPA
eukprot:TRINITY_DN22543_c0_g1_i1.p1 TRINITY_DN22543_c0_g1~~TRINITY_DN22543_c0_g1_i1.p1  ORF type:complete len:165 (+),score=22.44 TRINITY_DN22543_c0_g1_i1:543-1037(+)